MSFEKMVSLVAVLFLFVLFIGIIYYICTKLKKGQSVKWIEIVTLMITIVAFLYQAIVVLPKPPESPIFSSPVVTSEGKIRIEILSPSGAFIYYQINGNGLPDRHSFKYLGPFIVDKTVEVSAIAIDSFNAKSNINRKEFIIDQPTITTTYAISTTPSNFSNLSDEDKLRFAEQAFDAEDYETVISTYSNMTSNPIVQTNLGYMYANGIYFDQNIETALSYYNSAILIGYGKAITNKICLCIRSSMYDEAIKVINQYHKNPFVIDFINAIYKELDIEQTDRAFFKMKFAEQKGFIIHNLYRWSCSIVWYDFPQATYKTERYSRELAKIENVDSGDGSSIIYWYKECSRIYRSHLFSDEFITIE